MTTDARTVATQIKARDNHKARARASSVKAVSHAEADMSRATDEAAATKANDQNGYEGQRGGRVNPHRLNSLENKIYDNDEAGV